MKLFQHGSLWLAAAVSALTLVACTDRNDAAGPVLTGPVASSPPAEPVLLQAVDCRVEVRTMLVKCGPTAGGEGAPSHLIVGNQNEYVTLTSANPDYNPGTGVFTLDVTVRNLIPQPLGTADTIPPLAAEAEGVRVFFSTPPVATAGTGAITVAADGQAFFLSAGQDYYQYNPGVLDQFEVTAPKTWTFNVPATVETFHFGVYVAAAVPWPDGYVLISGNFDVRSAAERQLTAQAYNVVGEPDAGPTAFTWESLDSTRAAVTPAGGRVHGKRAGSTLIVATEAGGTRHGKVVMDVSPIRRIWTGAAGVTNWENGTNWLPDSIAPQPTDTAEITDASATIFPVLNQNETVGGLDVLDAAPGGVVPTVDMSAFDLHSGGSVIVTNSSAITGTGRLFLEGIAEQVQGTLPRVQVTGRYTLTGNITSRAVLRVVGGRLRNQSFRIRTQSN
ncbi:MAG TPA: hypothetical protein VE871_08990 [Longimicrobium sp.]|nr:hypothetical protein [Longimicrobium sp.]